MEHRKRGSYIEYSRLYTALTVDILNILTMVGGIDWKCIACTENMDFFSKGEDGRDIIEDSEQETLVTLSDEEFFQIEDIDEYLRPFKEKYEYRDEENGVYSEVWIQSCDD